MSAGVTYYAWGGSSVIAEYSNFDGASSLTWEKSYVYAGSRLLSTFKKSGTTEAVEYHHPDRLGTRLISNPVGATQVEQNTLPFGTSIDAETTGTSNQRFTSYDRSDSTGLDYAVNRTYNSGQSRFTQVDPIGMASASIGNPQSLNLFAYVQNNPIDFVDPTGLDEEIIYIDAKPAYRDRNYRDWSSWYQFVLHSMENRSRVQPEQPVDSGGGETPGGGSPLVELANEFYRRLDNGKCRQKLNDLLKALGNKLSIDDLAVGYFLGGIFGGKKKLLFEAPNHPTATGSYEDFTIRIRPRLANDGLRTESDTNNFEHELAHAASESSQGFSHERLIEAIADVEGQNFKSIKNQVKARVKAEKKKGNKTISKDGVYSGMLNKWLRKVCNPK